MPRSVACSRRPLRSRNGRSALAKIGVVGDSPGCPGLTWRIPSPATLPPEQCHPHDQAVEPVFAPAGWSEVGSRGGSNAAQLGETRVNRPRGGRAGWEFSVMPVALFWKRLWGQGGAGSNPVVPTGLPLFLLKWIICRYHGSRGRERLPVLREITQLGPTGRTSPVNSSLPTGAKINQGAFSRRQRNTGNFATVMAGRSTVRTSGSSKRA